VRISYILTSQEMLTRIYKKFENILTFLMYSRNSYMFKNVLYTQELQFLRCENIRCSHVSRVSLLCMCRNAAQEMRDPHTQHHDLLSKNHSKSALHLSDIVRSVVS